MHDWKSGLRKNVWLWVAITIGLMSGITSVVREGIATFRPSAVPPGRLFFTCLWISFVGAAIYVLVKQQRRIAELEAQIEDSSSNEEDIVRNRRQVAVLMEQGKGLAQELFQLPPGEFEGWDTSLKQWVYQVKSFLQDSGNHSDAMAFERAGGKIIEPGGVVDFRYKKERRTRILTSHRDALEDIAQRLF